MQTPTPSAPAEPTDFLTFGDAAREGKTSLRLLRRAVRDGHLEVYTDPMDRRLKLVSREQLQTLRRPRAARSDA